jgi:23S rRNA (uracil1939-C5)-methyltransferase
MASQTERSSGPPRLRLTPDSMAHRGEAIARHDGKVVFVAYGIPGEEAEVAIERNKRDYMVGHVEQVVSPSPHRVEPPCPYFGQCGGCQWQHIAYPYQLELKAQVVADQLRRLGGFQDPPVRPTLPAVSPWGYRNHARFTEDRHGNLGFITRGKRRFLRIDRCLIMDPRINDALARFQERFPGIHQLAVRLGVHTGQLLIHPDLNDRDPPLETGQPYYEEVLCGHRFRISAASFFQVNTLTAETLVELVGERLGLRAADVLVDAYAGVGTFARIFANRVRLVVAIEESSAAIRDARHNLQEVPNAVIHEGKVEDVLPTLEVEVDALILDPPRVGCHPRALEALLKLAPPRLVYVSCDPATLARDLAVLARGGYELREVQPIDLFPQTYHIEAVATLRRY